MGVVKLIKKEFTITEPTGLHARPVAVLVGTAGKYRSEIEISSNGISGNLKSILNVLSLMVRQQDQITITISGDDELEAMNKIESCLVEMNLI